MNSIISVNEKQECSRAQACPSTGSHWEADLSLRIEKTAWGSCLSDNRHQGPLYVQKPFYPEGRGLPHIYLLHPPGGLVSGDSLHIRAEVGAGAGVLLTTPGAGRIYRARAGEQRQQQQTDLCLAAGSSLEWLPLETIIYPGAQANLETRINLVHDCLFMGWELTCLGLPASGGSFDSGSLRQGFRIDCDGFPVLLENLVLDATGRALLAAAAGLQGYTTSGIFVIGPLPGERAESLLAMLRATQAAPDDGSRTGMTLVGPTGSQSSFIIARYLGHCAEACRRFFIGLWQLLRPLVLGRDACQPRIWAT
ncbi:MAG: urease accessory protein UreD [Pseudomonadales bacterium]|nr:urease accessory protein UreD [Pseudomonadales bacterium]